MAGGNAGDSEVTVPSVSRVAAELIWDRQHQPQPCYRNQG